MAALVACSLLAAGARATAASSSAAAGPVSARVYVVRPGDTVWSVAARLAGPHGDPRPLVDDLIRANALQDARIWPGQRLVLGS
jgi:Tfp pilus assembly protein FimV